MKKLLSIIIIAALTSCGTAIIEMPTAPDETQLQIFNLTDTTATVWITLGATEGCLQHVSVIPFVTDSLAPLVGSFTLSAGDSTQVYAPDSLGFNGVISFNTQPLNCPTPTFTNGVNIFEFIINNGFQSGNPQETIDISCVAGVSGFYHISMFGGGIWNAGAVDSIQEFRNSDIIHNSGCIGVFPYGCDTCTGAKSPPTCVTNSNDKQSNPICTVQRNAKGMSGGLIKIKYTQLEPLK